MTTALSTDFVDISGTPARRTSAPVDIAQTRAAQEVQAAMVIAQRFPRDEGDCFNRIMRACKRRMLAEQALYAYPRGGQTVTGPSIRLAEVLAQSWKNLDFGIIELEQKNGESAVMAYAWDLETNVRQTKVFTVKHERHKKGGKVDHLTDPRDIYEMTANQGARRVRACILGVIPGDIVDAALEECEKTLKSNNGEPLADRIRKMLSVFIDIGVTREMIEQRVGHVVDTINETELLQLRKIFQAVRDNMQSVDQFFNTPKPAGGATTDPADVSAKLKDQAAPWGGNDPGPGNPVDESDIVGEEALPEEPAAVVALYTLLANKCSCTIDEAREKIVSFCDKLMKGATPAELNEKQIKDVRAKIESGAITV